MLTLFAGDEGKVVSDGDVRVHYVSAETGIQIIGSEVLLNTIVADDLLLAGKAGSITARGRDRVCGRRAAQQEQRWLAMGLTCPRMRKGAPVTWTQFVATISVTG